MNGRIILSRTVLNKLYSARIEELKKKNFIDNLSSIFRRNLGKKILHGNKLQRKKKNEFYVNFNNKFKYINFKYTSIWLGWYRRLRLTMKQCNQQSVDDTRLLLGDRPGYAFHYVLEFMCSIRIIHPILRHDWNKMG